ncbi:hypothetical protein FRC03_001641 [Tulasnella sp. 419]|nr:hypothetical protein FRC03_001641 [Tulasnella sp. 419]
MVYGTQFNLTVALSTYMLGSGYLSGFDPFSSAVTSARAANSVIFSLLRSPVAMRNHLSMDGFNVSNPNNPNASKSAGRLSNPQYNNPYHPSPFSLTANQQAFVA